VAARMGPNQDGSVKGFGGDPQRQKFALENACAHSVT
jgi:hypothetical protein